MAFIFNGIIRSNQSTIISINDFVTNCNTNVNQQRFQNIYIQLNIRSA